MKKLLFILMTISFLTGCATLMQPTPELDQSLEELLEQAEGAGYDSTMTGAEVQAELDRCAGREITVGDPGSDAELVTEQAVREALNAKQGSLTNSAGLLAALDDETGTGLSVFSISPTFTTNLTTPQITISGADVSPAAAGEVRYDSTITGLSGGGLRWYDNDSIRVLVDLETDPADDDYCVTYDADADGFYMATFEPADAAIVKSDEAETITANWDFTANPMNDDEVSGDLTLNSKKLTELTSEASAPSVLEEFQADNDTFDPNDYAGTGNYITVLTRDTTELMPNQEDRDFNIASAWEDVDLSAYDEAGDLTITADTANQYCTCPVLSAPTTVGKRYRMTYDLANIVSTWTLKSFDNAQTIGTISANCTQGYLDWTATTTGGYRLVAEHNDSSGDFDNFTLNELPYVAVMDETGKFLISSIEVTTLEEDELNDDAGDRLLTMSEVRGPFISNKGVGAAFHLDFPAQGSDDTWNVCLIKEEDQDYTADPNGSEQWWFRNDNSPFSQLAAGENIVNTTNGRSMLCIKSTEDGVYATGDANWAEETP